MPLLNASSTLTRHCSKNKGGRGEHHSHWSILFRNSFRKTWPERGPCEFIYELTGWMQSPLWVSYSVCLINYICLSLVCSQ